MFHHFRDAVRHPAGQGAISADEFRQLLLHVGVQRILPAREFLLRHITGTLRPEHLCITFDDNVRCQYDVAVPVLDELNLTAFWFAYTSVLEGRVERLEVYRYFRTTRFASIDDFYASFEAALCRAGALSQTTMSGFDPQTYLKPFPFYTDADRRFRFLRDEVLGPARYVAIMDGMLVDAGVTASDLVRDLWMTNDQLHGLHEDGHVIGMHSHTHPTRLDRLSVDEQIGEYEANHAAIAALTGEMPITMSHPCNSYSPATLDVLRDMGVQLGFRSNLDKRDGCELEVPREDHTNILRQMRMAA